MNNEKLFESLLNEDGLFKPFAGFALTMAALTAIGIQNKNFDEKCKAIADELGVKLGKNAFDQRGSAYYMPYLQSFKYDGGSKDYGMTPEGLCKYIRKTAKVDNVEYKTVEGGVEILFVDGYSVNIGNVIHHREARGSFFVPDDYFSVSFTFQESNKKSFFEELVVKLNEKRFGENKEQLFDSILNEADDTYKAKVNGKWLKGNKLVKDKKDADTFESKTEPTQRINQMKKDGKLNKNAKPTIMKEYVSNQVTNTFMRHGVEKYFHEYIIVVDDDWYTPCEYIDVFELEDSFGPEYIFEQVVTKVKSSIRWLKDQGFQPDENANDEAYNLWEMIDFVGSLKENTMKNKNQLFENLLQEER